MTLRSFLSLLKFLNQNQFPKKVQIAIEIDEEITEEELAANELFNAYITERVANDIVNDQRVKEIINSAVKEYGENLDRIDYEFKQLTKLQDSDAAFLIGATALQVIRVLLINKLTEVEPAGSNNLKEVRLHDAQSKIFEQFNATEEASRPLYASKSHILSARGVPYDATRFADGNFGIF